LQLIVNDDPLEPHTFTLNASGVYEANEFLMDNTLFFNPVYIEPTSDVFDGDNFVNTGFLWNTTTPHNATIIFNATGTWEYKDIIFDFLGMNGFITVLERPRNLTGNLVKYHLLI
jgi:hypothetical protein